MSLSNLEPDSVAEGIRTGNWFAVGDQNHHTIPLSLPPPPIARGSALRRALVRTVGFLLIAFTVFCLVRIAMKPSARRAMLSWGSFGHDDRFAKK
jgi:hypothetical protein